MNFVETLVWNLAIGRLSQNWLDSAEYRPLQAELDASVDTRYQRSSGALVRDSGNKNAGQLFDNSSTLLQQQQQQQQQQLISSSVATV